MSTKNVMEKAWNAGKGALGEVSGPALHAAALGMMVGGAYWAAQTVTPGALDHNVLDSGQTLLMADGALVMMVCGVEMVGGAVGGAIQGWREGAGRVGQVVKENLCESAKTLGKGMAAVGLMAASAWLLHATSASGAGLDLSMGVRLAGLAASGAMGLTAAGLGIKTAFDRYFPQEGEKPQAKSEGGEAQPALTQAKLAKWRQGKEQPAAPRAAGVSLG